MRADETKSPDNKPLDEVEAIVSNVNMREATISNETIGDDESLVPASEADDSSYVLPSAPTTGNTLATTRSVDDLVLVNTQVTGATGKGML